MALTKDFKDTIQARAQRDPAFRRALLQSYAVNRGLCPRYVKLGGPGHLRSIRY